MISKPEKVRARNGSFRKMLALQEGDSEFDSQN